MTELSYVLKALYEWRRCRKSVFSPLLQYNLSISKRNPAFESNIRVHLLLALHNFFQFKNWFLFNPFPNKPCFLRVCCKSLLKTLWEKEKLLVTSNFSFPHSVFYSFRKLSANLKLLSANSFSLDESKICRFGKG